MKTLAAILQALANTAYRIGDRLTALALYLRSL